MTVSSTISACRRRGVPVPFTATCIGEPTSNGRILHVPLVPPVSRPKPRLNTVISVASVPVATNPPGIRFRTRWTV